MADSIKNHDSVSESARRRDGVSPLPWRVIKAYDDEPARIIDADDDEVAVELIDADAALIVEAVNGMDATLKLQRTLLGWSIERDRLRDIVRRLADIVRHDCDERAMAVTREAYAALGEEVPE